MASAPAVERPVFLWYPPLPIRHDDDGLPTHTSREQAEVERRVDETLRHVLPRVGRTTASSKRGKKMASIFGGADDDEEEVAIDTGAPVAACPALCELSTDMHATYLHCGLKGSGCHSSLDASRPWLVYWCLHGLDLLDQLQTELSDAQAQACVSFLARCVHPQGGMGGGPGQQAHTAPTYAAVMSLAILTSHPGCSSEALQVLRSARRGISDFFLRCKEAAPGSSAAGGFRVSRDGEVDTRGAYTVLAVASLLQLQTPALTAGVLEWLASCQTYEGGLGGEPGNEAHGGYSFCGLAAAALLGSPHRLQLPLLRKWAVRRHMQREGGFQGRTNKLVDGCYSFWVGALHPILDTLEGTREQLSQEQMHALFDERHAPTQQQPGAANPTASTDSAVAAAALSSPSASASPAASSDDTADLVSDDGVRFDSLALQRYVLVSCQMTMGGLRDKPGKHPDLYHSCYCLSGLAIAQHADGAAGRAPILGRKENLLQPTHPVYNIRHEHVRRIRQAFADESVQ